MCTKNLLVPLWWERIWTIQPSRYGLVCSITFYLFTACAPCAKNARVFARLTRKPRYRRQTRATRNHGKNCSNSTCLQRCCWQYWPIFIHLAVVASEMCEIPRNSLKIQTYGVQGHPRSSILVSMCEFILVINSNFSRICYRFRDIHG